MRCVSQRRTFGAMDETTHDQKQLEEDEMSITHTVQAPVVDGDIFERWARERSVRRGFWLSLAAFLAGEGLIGFLAILSGGFPRDVELSRSLLSGILCAPTALAGLALVKKGWLAAYARVVVVGAVFAFPLLVAFIWVPGGGAWSKLHWSAVAVLIGALLASFQRLWLGEWTGAVLKRVDFIVTSISIAVLVAVSVAEIWGRTSAAADRMASAFSLLAVVGFVLTPILRRALRERTERAKNAPASP
jgi:hypothetical protein